MGTTYTTDQAEQPDRGIKRRALCRGVPLQESQELAACLPEILLAAGREQPSHGIHYLDSAGADAFHTYAQLLEDASCVLRGLRSLGLQRGEKAILQLERSADFITAFWACILGGIVPVPLSIAPAYDRPNSVRHKLENAWALLDHPIVLCGDVLAPQLESFAAQQNLTGFHAAPFSSVIAEEPDREWVSSHPEELALLLLTSGSTGMPKAVMLTHRNLIGRTAAVVQHNGFTESDVSLNWMPLDHVGGIVMFHLRDVYLGCDQVHAPTEAILQQPLRWLDWIDKYRVTITWAPNFAFALINDQAEEIAKSHWDLSCLRFILNAGEAIVAKTARTFLSILAPFDLPPNAMHAAWGMSETSSGITYSDRLTLARTSDEDPLVEVGVPIPETEIRIADPSGNVVSETEIGSLQVRGVAVTSGYYKNPEVNAASFTPDGWFITGDLGFVRDGQLTISGRDKDVIIINGLNFHGHEIEAAVEELEGVSVSFTAACAVRRSGEDTDRLAIFFHTPFEGDERAALLRTVRAAVIEKVGVSPDYLVPLPKERIPKTAIGKIQRSQLKQQFENGEFAELLGEAASEEEQFLPEWIFRRTWRPAPLASEKETLAGACLVFAPVGMETATLQRRLEEWDVRTILVKPDRCYAQTDPNHFTIDPRSRGDYDRLFKDMRAGGVSPGLIVHLWTWNGNVPMAGAETLLDAQYTGVLSLLHLAQSLDAQCGEGALVRIAVVSPSIQPVHPDDRVHYEHGALLGLIRALPQEFAWAAVQHIDAGDADSSAAMNLLLDELQRAPAELELAYRNGVRFTVGLDRVPKAPAAADPLKHGGTYLLSGGLGGIGLHVAELLLRQHKARVILLGRTALPARSEWSAESLKDTALAERIRELQALEAMGGEVRYVSCDVTDLAAVRRAVSDLTTAGSAPLDGIFHLAGRYSETRLLDEDAAHFLQILSPKVAGAWVLNELVKDRPGTLFVNFSSVLSFFASYRSGAYSAANSFLDVFSEYQRSAVSLASCSLLWGSWSGVGMSQATVDDATVRAKGYMPLTTALSMDALELLLEHHVPEAVIGINSSHPVMQRAMHGASGNGETAKAEQAVVAPATETERRLVEIWSRVLKKAEVGVTSDFFELGGRSLLAAQIFAQIGKDFGKDLPLATLFKAPTIRELAKIVEGEAETSWCKTLALQVRGSRPPFFCIPGGGSDCIVFTKLSRHLGADQPFYGLQSRGLDATDAGDDFPSVEEIAALFVKEIRSVQPHGPYFIGGHCFGSLIAYETARQLQRQGEEIGLLALLDPIVSDAVSTEILSMDRLRYHWRKFWQTGFREKLDYAFRRIANFSRTLIVRNRIRGTFDQVEAMHRGYTLVPCAFPAALILADDSFFSINPAKDPRLTWKKLIEGDMQEFSVPGDHHTMLHEPAVIDLARDLRKAIDARLPSA